MPLARGGHTQAWAESPHFAAWAFEVKKLIRQGHVAVQLFADSDVMLLPDGQLVDLWGVDPWHALALDGVEVRTPAPLASWTQQG